MKNIYRILLVAVGLILTNSVFACETGGNQCYQTFGGIGAEFGVDVDVWGLAGAGAAGEGGKRASSAYTVVDNYSNLDIKGSLDRNVDCPECTKKQFRVSLKGSQLSAAGAQNSVIGHGPVSSVSEVSTRSAVRGKLFGSFNKRRELYKD